MFKRLIASLVCFSFIFSNIQYVHARDFSINQLPVPGTMVGESVPFTPLALKGLVINLQKPLEFQFIVDTGKGLQDATSIKEEANQLVKYFLAGLTIPEGDLWVNLSPYEKNRMVPEALGQTDLGRDLLAQDYLLKQLTASLIYPEKDLGKEFWSRVYSKAQQQFGTTNIPVNTFNKVWILPDQAQIYENVNAAYVTKATLKVMLDEDYTALQKHISVRNSTDSIGSQIVRQIILPEIEKEVNMGKNFAPLRQIYQALILAKWYKETIQNSLLDAVYTNKNKVAGVNLSDPAVKEQIYNRYLQAYKKGAFDYIKEDPTPDGQVVPRKYFSGGTSFAMISLSKINGNTASMLNVLKKLVVAGAGAFLLMTVSCNKETDSQSYAFLIPHQKELVDDILLYQLNYPSIEYPELIKNMDDQNVHNLNNLILPKMIDNIFGRASGFRSPWPHTYLIDANPQVFDNQSINQSNFKIEEDLKEDSKVLFEIGEDALPSLRNALLEKRYIKMNEESKKLIDQTIGEAIQRINVEILKAAGAKDKAMSHTQKQDAAMFTKLTILKINMLSNVDKIEVYLSNSDSDVRKVAREALDKLALYSDIQYKVGIVGLGIGHIDNVKWAIKLLVKARKKEAIPLIAEKLNYDDSEVRRDLREALIKLEADPETIFQANIKVFSNSSESARKDAVEWLGDSGDKRAIGPIADQFSYWGFWISQSIQAALEKLATDPQSQYKVGLAGLFTKYPDTINWAKGMLEKSGKGKEDIEILMSENIAKSYSIEQEKMVDFNNVGEFLGRADALVELGYKQQAIATLMGLLNWGQKGQEGNHYSIGWRRHGQEELEKLGVNQVQMADTKYYRADQLSNLESRAQYESYNKLSDEFHAAGYPEGQWVYKPEQGMVEQWTGTSYDDTGVEMVQGIIWKKIRRDQAMSHTPKDAAMLIPFTKAWREEREKSKAEQMKQLAVRQMEELQKAERRKVFDRTIVSVESDYSSYREHANEYTAIDNLGDKHFAGTDLIGQQLYVGDKVNYLGETKGMLGYARSQTQKDAAMFIVKVRLNRILNHNTGDELTSKLTKFLGGIQSVDTKAEMIKILGDSGRKEAVEPLLAEIDQFAWYRKLIEVELRKLGASDEQIRNAYVRVVSSNVSSEDLKAFLERLVEFDDQRFFRPLLKLLGHRKYHVFDLEEVEKTLIKLGIGVSQIVDEYIGNLNSKNVEVRINSIKRLGELEDSRAINPLLKLCRLNIDHTYLDDEYVPSLFSALKNLNVHPEDLFEGYKTVLESAISNREERTSWRRLAIEGLLVYGGERVSKILEQDMMNHLTSGVALQEALEIIKIGTYQDRDVLERLISRQPNTRTLLLSFATEGIQFKREGYDFKVIYTSDVGHMEYSQGSEFGGGFTVESEGVLRIERGDKLLDAAMNGGIDLNQIKVNRTGKTINVQFDPAQLTALEQGGFQGFTPVIINIQRISSPFQLLGINSAKEPEVFAKA